MELVGFATNRGFGHWSRMRNYISLPPLRDKSLFIAPITPAGLSWKDVNTLGYVDHGIRIVLEDDGSHREVKKYDPGVNFEASVEWYYFLPWSLTYTYGSRTLVIDAHNEPELLYFDEFFSRHKGFVNSCRERSLKKIVFTLETQTFKTLPLRYKKAFEKVDIILVPYEEEFFVRCVPSEPFKEFRDKMLFVGNIISPEVIKILQTPPIEARRTLGLPEDKKIVFCSYGRGEGANNIVQTLVGVGDRLSSKFPDVFFVVSDPLGEFKKLLPYRDWMSFLGLDYQKAMMTLAACDCTIQGLGTSTLIESLVAGKPMVAISLERPYEEQDSKGRGVEAFGVGKHIPLNKASADTILDMLLQVLEEEYRKQSTRVLPKILGDLKGAERTAKLLVSYL